MGASSTICVKLLVRVLGKLPGFPKLTLNFTRVTVIEATVKRVVRNEATGQVLGVQYIRKGEDHREYVCRAVHMLTNSLVFCTSHLRGRRLFFKLQEGICKETCSSAIEFRRTYSKRRTATCTQPWPCRPRQQCSCFVVPDLRTRHKDTSRCSWETAISRDRSFTRISTKNCFAGPTILAPSPVPNRSQ